MDYVGSPSTILIENPIAVVDSYVKKYGNEDLTIPHRTRVVPVYLLGEVVHVLWTSEAAHALGVTLVVSALCVVINGIFGVVGAIILTPERFLGRRVIGAFRDRVRVEAILNEGKPVFAPFPRQLVAAAPLYTVSERRQAAISAKLGNAYPISCRASFSYNVTRPIPRMRAASVRLPRALRRASTMTPRSYASTRSLSVNPRPLTPAVSAPPPGRSARSTSPPWESATSISSVFSSSRTFPGQGSAERRG